MWVAWGAIVVWAVDSGVCGQRFYGWCVGGVVYLDGSPSSVFPCVEGVGGGEGSNCFDDVSELCLGSIRSPWARAGVGGGGSHVGGLGIAHVVGEVPLDAVVPL